MKNGPVLTHSQQVALCAKVTDKEISAGLCSISDEKAHGVDGYNLMFFKKIWPMISHDIYGAVKDFFATGQLYRAMNYTTVTLLPKVSNSSTNK